MAYAMVTFTALPRIGFAHHFQMEHYARQNLKTDSSLEIVYIKDGAVRISCYGYTGVVQPGSVVVILRQYPFSIEAIDGQLHRHCSLQLNLPYTAALGTEGDLPREFSGLAIPIILPPCTETETIKKELYTIVSDIGIARGEREFSCTAAALGVLAKLDRLQRQQAVSGNTSSLWEYRIKQYITRHIHKPIALSDIAAAMEKTPNYLNSVFCEATGMGIGKYINNEKVKLIAEIMENREISFKEACSAVGITDVSYGYRLFKKHMGVTMRAYLAGERKHKNG